MARLTASLPLCSALLFAAGCGGSPPPPPPPPPPQVSLILAETDVVGRDVSLSLEVSGCHEIAALELDDGKHLLKSVAPKGTTTATRLEQGDFHDESGIAVHAALQARAVCD